MNTLITFLIDNYVWFLVISIVLIFSLIGYLVESSKVSATKNTDKVADPVIKPKEEKKERTKKEKNKKKNSDDDILEDNTPTIAEMMAQEAEKKQEEHHKEQKDEVLDSDTQIKSEEPITIEEQK